LFISQRSCHDTRHALTELYCLTEYDVKNHYDLRYIHRIVDDFITFFELQYNPLLDNCNSEGFLQAHVFAFLVDRLFFDIPSVQVVRGEKASRAVSFRKNALRQLGTRKKNSLKLDAALLTRDTWCVEILAMESSPSDSVEGQTKKLGDTQKLGRELKDQINFIYSWLPSDQKSRVADIEVFGIVTSGLEGIVYVMDLPCPGVYRFGELFRFQLPKQFDSYPLLIKAITRFLVLKERVLSVLTTLEDIKVKTMQQALDTDILWSPKRPHKTHPTRQTPETPKKAVSGEQKRVKKIV